MVPCRMMHGSSSGLRPVREPRAGSLAFMGRGRHALNPRAEAGAAARRHHGRRLLTFNGTSLLTPAPRWGGLSAPSVLRRRGPARDTAQISRGKFDRLPRAPAGCTPQALDGCGLCGDLSARPTWTASDPISVRQVAVLLHAAFGPRLATTPLRFASTSPPSGRAGDLHPQAVEHARHTSKPLARRARPTRGVATPRPCVAAFPPLPRPTD